MHEDLFANFINLWFNNYAAVYLKVGSFYRQQETKFFNYLKKIYFLVYVYQLIINIIISHIKKLV